MEVDGKQRLAKVLAARGIASRREAEKLIEKGLVEVDGEVIRHPGHPVDPDHERIYVDGKLTPTTPRKAYYLLNKPTGYIVSRADPDGRRSVLELLPELPERVEPVGRLDINTEGALLLTNDGALAHSLTHPSREIPKRYLVKVWKEPNERKLAQLETGVHLEDGKTAPAKVRIVESTDGGNTWLELTVTEGRNRLVRRMFAAIGHPVSKLKRVSFATISVRDLPVGQFRLLTAEEVTRLRELARGVNPQRAGQKKKERKAGFASPGEAWMKKRVHRKAR
ncbi:MAG TPA: pseudouridine synthase [Myxococcota bacterium]|nr:pseudouridine synthase [Myxococcota bacterium]HNH49980.1 pseudouridine synthase [Myxococcota bacterium]